MLELFAGFWAGTEPAIDAWALRDPAAASRLQWPRRRRGDRLARDLARLGGPVATPVAAAPVFGGPGDDGPDEAAVLGWLYVSEGSTLGGAVIDRALRSRAGYVALETFAPYAEGPGPMWRSYLAELAAFADTGADTDTATDTDRDDARRRAVLAAGVRTFGALEAWLAPLGCEPAA